MNHDPNCERLREAGWRGELTGPEAGELRAWLAAHPEAQPDWETEAALTRVLHHLPDVPVATNFTARVLQAVEREAPPASRPAWRPPAWLPKLAFALVTAGLSVIAVHQSRVLARERLAQSVAVFSEVRAAPSPEILQDFDAINRLSPAPAADTELIALLK